ncbi:thioredoxin family protein [Leucobacter sp. GX24907]
MTPLAALTVIAGLLLLAVATGLLLRFRRGEERRLPDADRALDPGDFGLDAFGTGATIVQFSTVYCARCPQVRRRIADLLGGRRAVAFAHIDVTHDAPLVAKHELRQTPTVLLLDGAGIPRARFSGTITGAELSQALERVVGGDR